MQVTPDEIIEMARQSGAMFDHMTWVERDLLPVFERFAKLVAEREREACAKVADDADGYSRFVNQFISKRIRARGEQA